MSILGATPFDGIFAELTRRLGVLVSAETSPSMRDRVLIERSGGLEPRPIPYRVAGERTRGRMAHKFTVRCYGASDIEATARAQAFADALDDVLGPKQGDAERETLQPHAQAPVGRGYEIAAGKTTPAGGDGASSQYVADLEMVLYTRHRTRIRGSASASPRLTLTPAEPSALAEPSDLQLLTG